MKISLNAVKKYIDLSNISVEEIANRLTFAGVEVEGYDSLAKGTNLTVGQVLTCENMPDSDHLHLTTVDAGKHGILNIVCGAPNVRKGLKVIVALDGAKLPGGTIHNGKVRGHESNGMLCSLAELGVDAKFLSEQQKSGIEELPDDFAIGSDNVLELLALDDTILDLKLLANRSDLYSVFNVAKELETLFKRKANIPTYNVASNSDLPFSVNSLTPKCPQFSARVMRGITVKSSPRWLQNELRSMGIRSINNIVDIGNLVMLLTGQPLHMYDEDKLASKELIVRDDIEGTFVALDEKSYELKKGDLCVTSKDKVMCLAGVMGSKECAVSENTKNIVIEVANFDFASIRRTSIRLNLVSDSSQRYVKGINPNQYEYVLNFAAYLINELCGVKEIGQINTYLKEEYKAKTIISSLSYINNRLGTSFSDEAIINTLNDDHIITKKEGDKLICQIPDHRIDISGEADLSEEVIRILGFENVESSLPSMQLSVGGQDPLLAKKRLVRDFLRGLGLDEQLTYSLIREKETKDFVFLNKDEPYKIINPLTDEHEYVRTNILPSLMNALKFNINHGTNDTSFFEVSDLYSSNNHHMHLAVVLSGSDLRRYSLANEAYSFYHMKGILEALLDLFNIDIKRVNFERSKQNELHPGKSADAKVDGHLLASFGELHPDTYKKYAISNLNVVVMELDLAVLFNVKVGAKKMIDISRFPSVKRDFAFILKDDVSAKEIISEVKKVDRNIIKSVDIFDVYRGEHIKENYYSLAFSVTFNSLDKTLVDNEINDLQEKIIKVLENKFNAELRK